VEASELALAYESVQFGHAAFNASVKYGLSFVSYRAVVVSGSSSPILKLPSLVMPVSPDAADELGGVLADVEVLAPEVLAADVGLLVLDDDVDPDELHAPSASAQMEAAARPTMDLRILGPTSQVLD
jgi:hypothetical protein